MCTYEIVDCLHREDFVNHISFIDTDFVILHLPVCNSKKDVKFCFHLLQALWRFAMASPTAGNFPKYLFPVPLCPHRGHREYFVDYGTYQNIYCGTHSLSNGPVEITAQKNHWEGSQLTAATFAVPLFKPNTGVLLFMQSVCSFLADSDWFETQVVFSILIHLIWRMLP